VLGRAKFDAGSPRFGKADRDGLSARLGGALTSLHFVHLFADEFTRLGGRFFSLTRVFPRFSDNGGFRHGGFL
jgi:hypothetical protein